MTQTPCPTVASDGTIRQGDLRPAHRPLDAAELAVPERAAMAFVEHRIRTRHPKLVDVTARRAQLDPDALRFALPRTVNEKFAWRKFFDRDPRFPIISDKVAIKDWLRRNGLLAAAPTIWAGDDPDAIPEAVLERRCLFKAAHSSGAQMFVVPGETTMRDLRRRGRRMLGRRYGFKAMEWGYDDVPLRILFEEELVPRAGAPVEEVKVFVFGGRIDRILRIFNRYDGISGQVWRADGAHVVRPSPGEPIDIAPSVSDRPPSPNWAEIIGHAARIGALFDQMRVDFLTDGETLWLNELTIYSQAGRYTHVGNDPAAPAALHWDLRQSHFMRTPQRRPALELYRRTLRRILDRAAPGPTGAASGS
ncbi:ATP-grasp fold amidoligase family protein [Jannaschia sp. W003]|uniref:ATP-grasp fold amidoligase family protein n=1 Tax=Jannaschia sp. W003 TaxID=2867012 RepID=UPI0021A8FC9D|nr:ATP-grasp fold amidoligase family protein [Jannaschia sp. W003]UWQ22508.1 hypothetical protein K3554_05650 [Jannaschia sp. W003]